MKQKSREHREHSLRQNELKISKTDIENKIDGLKQKTSHFEAVKDLVKLKITESKKKVKNTLKENQFDFTDYVENSKNKTSLTLFFFELKEENKFIYTQVPVNTLIENMEKMKMHFVRIVILV